MTELTDRYVHAATRFIPDESERTEVARELHERIEDTADALRASGMSDEDAEYRTISDLGDPLRVMAEYRGRPMHLIGPRFYFSWLRIIVIALAIGPAVVALIDVIGSAADREPVGAIIGSAIVTALTVAGHVVFWVTLTFAILERCTTPKVPTWTPEMLPQPADRSGARGRRSDLIASLAFLGVCAGLLIWQQLGSPFFADGERVPVLDPALWRLWIPVMLALLALEAAHAIWVYRDGWSWPAALTNIPLSLAWGALLVWLVTGHRLFNPDFLTQIKWSEQKLDETMPFIVGGIVIIIGWEIVDALIKTARGQRAAG